MCAEGGARGSRTRRSPGSGEPGTGDGSRDRDRGRRQRTDGDDERPLWPVEVLLPDPPPVRLAAIMAVERFFADIVDAVLAPEACPDPRAEYAGGQKGASPESGRVRPRRQRRPR